MTTNDATAEVKVETEAEDKPGLFGKLKDKVKASLCAIDEHCKEVENAKAESDRENIKKYGKDWVNRCCG